MQTSSYTAGRILDNLSTSILVFDADMQLSYINPAAENLLHESHQHAIGRHAEQIFPFDPEVNHRLQDALASNHPFSDREMSLQPLYSERTVVCCMVTPVIEPGRPSELVVEMVPVERHLRIVQEDRLLTQNDATRALIRGLAHEVKNPLGGLRGAAQLLEQELADDELCEYTRIIIGEADRLRNLLDRMLGPNQPVPNEAVNVHEALVRVQQLIAAEIGGNVHLHTDYDPSLPEVNWDLDQLIQTLLNLVRNAAQALTQSPQGPAGPQPVGGNITLRTRGHRHFNIGHKHHRLLIRIEVIDDGPGIDPALLPNIFLPMVTSRRTGTGLGLSIAQTMVQRIGGLIECTSEPGNTNFSIYLPLADSR